MENQHQQIKGYRDLSQKEIDLINDIKDAGSQLDALIDRINISGGDPRWSSIAKTALQKGMMFLVRAVAQPEGF